MNRPRIAIPVPTSFDLEYNRRSLPLYLEAIRAAGGQPVEISLTQEAETWPAIARSCDGVLLPGSPADVDPAAYGHPADPASAKPDAAREKLDFLLLEEAADQGKPVLGICFGAQSMNTWRGGTLVQDLLPAPVNHSAGPQVAIAHGAFVAPDSLLGSLVDRSESLETDGFLRLPINTSHHQAVGVPGEGLRIVARCPEDGVIEAVEGVGVHSGVSSGFFLGVQWHPERSIAISATSRALFKRLVQEAATYSENRL